jgi:hypothetical protein
VVAGEQIARGATALTADPAKRFGSGLQLFLDGIRQRLALLPSASRARQTGQT